MQKNKSDKYELVYQKILNFLSYRPRSEKEVLDRMKKYTVSEEVTSEIIQSLKADGYLNDRKVIELFVNSFKNSPEKRSINTFKQSLIKKGFSRSDVEESVVNLPDTDERQNALYEATKKLKALSGEPPLKKRAKLQNFLYGKGYKYEVIRSVVDSLL